MSQKNTSHKDATRWGPETKSASGKEVVIQEDPEIDGKINLIYESSKGFQVRNP